MDRRQFLKGTAALFAAPAIVKAENIMPIWVPPQRVIPHGLREDLTELVYDISPTDTPLLTAIQAAQPAPYHVWCVDDLISDHHDRTIIAKMGNQIFRKEVHVMNTPSDPRSATRAAYQTAKKLKEIKRDMEWMLMENARGRA